MDVDTGIAPSPKMVGAAQRQLTSSTPAALPSRPGWGWSSTSKVQLEAC